MALSSEMKRCIDICLDCYKTCLDTAMNYCLETGGEHVAPAHFRLMTACAEMCRIREFHADRLAAPQTHLPGMR
jgi:hypothetical protein